MTDKEKIEKAKYWLEQFKSKVGSNAYVNRAIEILDIKKEG